MSAGGAPPRTPPLVSLLTDYGLEDEFVGVLHGVILGACPDVRIVDLTHGIARHDVRAGALALRNALPHLPRGVHLAVVDPEVGTERRAVAVGCADGRLLVGPDNGILSLAWAQCGGVEEAVDVSRSPHRLEPLSPTFHGRDLFAPVAAHLAAGAELAEAGRRVDPEGLVSLALATARVEDGCLVAQVIGVDRFGNVTLDATHETAAEIGLAVGRPVELEAVGERYHATLARTFADVGAGEILIYEDPYRALALAVNRGDAAATMRLRENSEIRLRVR